MPTDLTSRLGGARSSLAFKAPVRCATTANITLSGFQTIDGITPASGDTNVRILVKDQTNAVTNGIYEMSSGAWSRAKDFDGADDIIKGTRVYVANGSSNGDSEWVVSTTDPITIDTSSISFQQATETAGAHAVWVPSLAMIARTTNGASQGTAETSSNKVMLITLDFDASTQEYAQFGVRMPKSWNESTLTARFVWSHASTSTNFGVVWGIQGVALSDADALDSAFGTAVEVADTGGTTDTTYITSATSAFTIANSPAAEDYVVFQVYRKPSDGSDTMAVDARLHGVTLYLTTDVATDD